MADLDRLTEVARAQRGFVRSYGLFWSAEEIDWDIRKSRLGGKQILGRVNASRNSLKIADFWEQKGIYVLYNDHGPYYVGKTARLTLGQRLLQHQSGSSKHHQKWNRFSWFGFRAVLKATDPNGISTLGKMPSVLLTNNEETIGDIEALMILSLGTMGRGNSREETFRVAQRWEQIQRHERDYYQERVAKRRP